MGILNLSFSDIMGLPGHFASLNRQYQRIKEKRGRKLSELDIDDYFAFFITAYHLRDRVIAVDANVKKRVEKLFAQNESLKVLRDICNIRKHHSISQESIDDTVSFHREWDAFDKEMQHFFTAGETKFEIFSLARDVYLKWQQFFIDEGFLQNGFGRSFEWKPELMPKV